MKLHLNSIYKYIKNNINNYYSEYLHKDSKNIIISFYKKYFELFIPTRKKNDTNTIKN